MDLKVTLVFAMRHYAGNALKREPALRRACVLCGHASYSRQSTLRTAESCADVGISSGVQFFAPLNGAVRR
jgi:hypothetical protein